MLTMKPAPPPESSQIMLELVHCPAVADPKLANGDIPVSYRLKPVGATYQVSLWITRDGALVRQVFSGPETGTADPITVFWDGRDNQGVYVTPGSYKMVIRASGMQTYLATSIIHVVRLGITEMEAQAVSADDEWQMVYFRKGGSYAFYTTPAIHEYLNTGRGGEVADLDLDDGNPRPAQMVHRGTASPVMDGSSYEAYQYNYPVCYRMGVQPRLEVTYGSTCASDQGQPLDCGYPLPGMEIRCRAVGPEGEWEANGSAISPGSSTVFTGPALPQQATRTNRTITWSWQYRYTQQARWFDIPGILETPHRFYTLVGEPQWANGASGPQYNGPWVEVVQFMDTFSKALGIDAVDEASLQEVMIRGFFGQEAGLTTAIEGIIYDTYTMGGDGGASHYYQGSSENIRLSRLLNNHAMGTYVNCSDVAGATSAMISMLGVENMRMLYLGKMYLRALWGIGCPDYTLNLWGGGSHSFSYHHIITRTGGTSVSDACMWLDEDGNPDALPGQPGYNCDRPWTGANGYNALSSSNSVSKTLDSLPTLN